MRTKAQPTPHDPLSLGDLSHLYLRMQEGDADATAKALAFAQSVHTASQMPLSPLNLPGRYRRWRQEEQMVKAIGQEYVRAQMIAKEQGAMVGFGMDRMQGVEGTSGVIERNGLTFGMLRQLYHHCEPLKAIVDTRIRQSAAFCQPYQKQHGYGKKPGYRIRLTQADQKMTAADKARIAELTNFFVRFGYTEPPRSERSKNWQPGFKAFVKAFLRDSLVLDFAHLRRWASAENPKKYPLIALSWEDGARIRFPAQPIERIVDGVPQFAEWQGQRQNTTREITRVKMSDGNWSGGTPVAEFTDAELATFVRNPRTDEEANGYGYPESEAAVNAALMWIQSREYNASRFRKDALPRGLITILGQLDDRQFQGFKIEWAEMLKGMAKRWDIPILRGLPGQGSQVLWTPFDLSSRDMEYHQQMYTVALWFHAFYGIHPEETGWDAASPFRPPLSESSPETKLEYSQDSGLAPLMTDLADFINREILWILDPEQRYTFEWVGLGQGDEMADIQLVAARLEAGVLTPRQALAELDEEVPDILEDDPAMDMLGTWAANREMLLQMQQMATQTQMQQDQQAHSQDMERQQADLQRVQQMQAMRNEMQTEPEGAGGAEGGGESGSSSFVPNTPLQKALLSHWI